MICPRLFSVKLYLKRLAHEINGGAMDISLSGKHALVTGASQGIGEAIAISLAGEVAKDGVTVNSVLPGKIDTPRLHTVIQSWAEKNGEAVDTTTAKILDGIPAKRFGTPKEFADVVVFLCTSATAYVTGVALPVDGGNTPCY